MTLNELLLEKLANWRPADGRQTFVVSGPATTVTIVADRNDVVGSQLWEVTLQLPAVLDAVGLKTWAEKCAVRVTGLLEPLRLQEVDAERGIALLRSQAPTQRGDTRFYYELLLHGDGRAQLARYQTPAKPESRREQIPFALTHESVAKVVADVDASR